MSLVGALLLMVVGIVLVVFFSERLVEGAVRTSYGFGVSAFLVSVLFLGFDPENLAVGAAGAYEGIAGIALGSILGAGMVALALAFGVTALFAPMTFEKVPRRVLGVPVVAIGLLGGLLLDGVLSRIDGALLLLGYAAAVGYLIWLSRKGIDVEVGATPREAETENRWRAVGRLLLALVLILVGSEMVVEGSEVLIQRFGLSDTFFGMAILALLVSIEELARELPAAVRGRPDISFGTVVGSALAFFLFNAGGIALVRPMEVPGAVLQFYLPVVVVTTLVIALLMLRKHVGRGGGLLLVLLYLLFFAGGFLAGETSSLGVLS